MADKKEVKLSQVIAIEKGIKSRVTAEVDKIDKAAQKSTLFDGFIKTYKKRDDADEDIPQQRQKVQMSASQAIETTSKLLTEMFDVTAQKDWANQGARADIEFEGETILSNVPATFLLFLEKQLTDLHTLIGRFPTLDPAEDWKLDGGQGIYKTEPSLTSRSKKVQKPLVLYPATDKHPAQTQLITEDVTVGTWEQTKFSGAIPEVERRTLLTRIEKLQHAVKYAREHANLAPAPEQKVGEKILGLVFKP